MFRAFLIIIALALSACASQPNAPVRASSQGGVTGFATAALWGSWEADLAPAYTRLAALRYRGSSALDAGRISVETALAIQKIADQARRLLDDSRRSSVSAPTLLQRAQLAEAQRLLTEAEALMENRP